MKYDKESIEKINIISKTISNLIKTSIFIIIIVIVYNTFLVILSTSTDKETTSIFGYSAYIITTDSMKPNLNAGDVIIVKKTNCDYLKKDDVITFKKDYQIITHRITNEIDGEFVTKGDNNNIEDLFTVRKDEIIGIKVFKFPCLGYIIKILTNIFYIIVIIIILATIYLYNKRKNKKKMIRRKKKRLEDEKKDC